MSEPIRLHPTQLNDIIAAILTTGQLAAAGGGVPHNEREIHKLYKALRDLLSDADA